jgi:hypothetical protein
MDHDEDYEAEMRAHFSKMAEYTYSVEGDEYIVFHSNTEVFRGKLADIGYTPNESDQERGIRITSRIGFYLLDQH